MTVVIEAAPKLGHVEPSRPAWIGAEISDEEFARLQETDGSVRGYELHNGNLTPMPPTFARQSTPWGRLFARLSVYLEEADLGEAWLDVATYLDPDRRRWRLFPDISYLATDELSKLDFNRINGAPTMVCEVTTNESRQNDYVVKMEAYHRAEVPWYWIVDVEDQVVKEFQHADAGYELISTTPFAAAFSPQLFPGFAVVLERQPPR